MGVLLIEIVLNLVISSVDEVVVYVDMIRKIVFLLNIFSVKME